MADKKEAVYNSKEFLEKMGEKKAKFKYTDTVRAEYLKDSGFNKKGKVSKNMFKLKAEHLAELGIVKILK